MERWTFGNFLLDLDTHELVRAGTPVSLSPKAFQLLGILVENRPKALSKPSCRPTCVPALSWWRKNLTNLVSEIREALGDNPVHPRFIRSVHRFGYAFREAPATETSVSGVCSRAVGAVPPVPDDRRHNLPVQLTNFIGRDQEIAQLVRLVASTRLLTLTGAGGCGKTRLALELAANVLDRFPDGVWFVDLSAVYNPGLVTQTVASVLNVEGPNRPIREALLDYVRSRQILLVLDNCEHLITACAQLAEALLRAPPCTWASWRPAVRCWASREKPSGASLLYLSRNRFSHVPQRVWSVPTRGAVVHRTRRRRRRRVHGYRGQRLNRSPGVSQARWHPARGIELAAAR